MTGEDESQYFTLVFKGDIRTFKGNPLKTDTPFGVPLVVSVGDVVAERDELKERLDNIKADELEKDW